MIELISMVVVIILVVVVPIYARRIGVRGLCPNCGQRQTGWATQCPRCGVVFKEWKNESAKTEGRWKNLYMSCCII